MGPRHSSRWIRSWTGAIELRVEGLRCIRCFAPSIPSLRCHVARELRIEVNNAGKRPPRTAETSDFLGGNGWIFAGNVLDPAGHFAVHDHIPGGLIGRGTRLRSQVAGSVGV